MAGERERIGADEGRLQQSQDRKIWRENLRQRLNRWKNVCVVCHSQGKDSMHTINRCPSEDSVEAERERKYAQRAVKFPQSHVCFKCGVPRLNKDAEQTEQVESKETTKSNITSTRVFQAEGKRRCWKQSFLMKDKVYGKVRNKCRVVRQPSEGRAA